jgi:hypothetical protein
MDSLGVALLYCACLKDGGGLGGVQYRKLVQFFLSSSFHEMKMDINSDLCLLSKIRSSLKVMFAVEVKSNVKVLIKSRCISSEWAVHL